MRRALLILLCALPMAAQSKPPVDLGNLNLNLPKESTFLRDLQANLCKSFPDSDECVCRKERYKKQCIADRKAARAKASAALKARLAASQASVKATRATRSARPATTQAPIDRAAPAPPRNTVRIVGLDEGTRETPLQR